MKKYAKMINNQKQCEVGLGTNADFYKSIGMTEQEVEQAYNGKWYVAGYAPTEAEKTQIEIESLRRNAYIAEVDPITAHISRLQDGEQSPEIVAEIDSLKLERDVKVSAIKERFPYPESEAHDD